MAKKKAIETGRDDYLVEGDDISTLKHWYDGMQGELYTAMPGRVLSYDQELNEAIVEPCVNDRYGDGDPKPHPPVTNCPVIFFTASGSSITKPPAPGDYGLLIWSKQSIDEWGRRGGTKIQPTSRRYHDVNDAMFLPGLRFAASPPESLEAGELLVGDDAYDYPDGSQVPMKRLRIVSNSVNAWSLDVTDAGAEGETWTVTIDGTPVSYTVQAGDRPGAVVVGLNGAIHDAGLDVDTAVSGFTLAIRGRELNEPIAVSVTQTPAGSAHTLTESTPVGSDDMVAELRVEQPDSDDVSRVTVTADGAVEMAVEDSDGDGISKVNIDAGGTVTARVERGGSPALTLRLSDAGIEIGDEDGNELLGELRDFADQFNVTTAIIDPNTFAPIPTLKSAASALVDVLDALKV